MGHVPFLPPNQQCQSTEGNLEQLANQGKSPVDLTHFDPPTVLSEECCTAFMLAAQCKYPARKRRPCANVSVVGGIAGRQRSAGRMPCDSAEEVGGQEEQFPACVTS